MILKAAHSFGNLRLDNDAERAINQAQAGLAKTCETKTIDHREQVRSQKTSKDGGTHKDCAAPRK